MIELSLGLGPHEALFQDQPGQYANGESATAEAQAENLVVLGDDACVLVVRLGLVVPAKEFVEAQHIAFKAEPESAAEDRGWLERGCANAVVVDRDLVGLRQIDGFERAPDIGSPDLGGGVAGAIRQ